MCSAQAVIFFDKRRRALEKVERLAFTKKEENVAYSLVGGGYVRVIKKEGDGRATFISRPTFRTYLAYVPTV